MDPQDINVEVKPTGDELRILTGDAPKINNPSPIKYSGDIEAPARYFAFLEQTEFNPLDVFVKVDTVNGSISMEVKPNRELEKVQIDGALRRHPLLDKVFGVNSSANMSKREFTKKLKMNRHYFPNREANMDLVASLEKLDLKIEKQVKDHDERRGSRQFEIKQVCKSEIPEIIQMEAPVFIDTEPQIFDIEIDFEVQDSKPRFFLHSPELSEYIDREGAKIVEKAASVFAEKVTVIYV